ncbi:hypothetical protein N6H18_11180 [Reichenbachiella agarivorans]|uniref:HTTM domain-containing protein n=1 Tax=Reichenbachiella agarivorans TaxID=2979464 RepID=A0ABY6CNH9_9BACT|nr:hypothetical protein [Reichenbachiella agarivorans]UXP30913.1 hypothetical protein N6H18_11180 [Reichenbachiella agarivorans]
MAFLQNVRLPQWLYSNLFDYEAEETKGDFYAFKFFELVVLVYVIQFAWDWGFYIQKISDVVLPLGMANYIDVSFMFHHNISLVNAAIMVVAGLVGFFRLNKYGYAVCLVSFHLHYISRYCLGEISHGSNLVGMAVLLLALAQWSFGNTKNMRVFALGMTYFYFGFGYTSAGICKLIATGYTWVDGSNLWMWIYERSVDVTSKQGFFEPNLLQEWALSSHLFATLTLLFGILAELTAFLIWFKKTRTFSVLILLGMHIGISISMNIMFMENIIIMFSVMYPWGRIIDRFLPSQAMGTHK